MRKLERHFLRWTSVLTIIGLSVDLFLGSTGEERWWGPALGAMLASLWAITAWILRRKHFQGDELLLPLVALLSGIGIVFLFHFQPALAWRQAMWLTLGLVFFLLLTLALPSSAWLESYCYLSGAGAFLLLALTLLFGKSIGGARSWLEVGPLTFEPSELSKILLVVFLAGYLARTGGNLVNRDLQVWGRLLPRPNWTYLGPALLVWGGSLLLLALQKDIGAAVLALAVFLIMVYIASGERALLLFGLFCSAAALAGAALIFPHVRLRFSVWLHPWRSATEGGYQLLQGLFALGTGGLWGTGLGHGQPEVIPAVATDLVLAGIGEELGLAGSAAVLLALWLLLGRGLIIARRARDRFDQLLALGFTAVLAVQAFAITGGVVRLLPLTGVPFPFVSYGGSALVSNLILIGLLAKVDAEGGTALPDRPLPERALVYLWTGITAAFSVALLALAWWQLMAGPGLAQDPRNPRVARRLITAPRGGIYAQGGEVLVVSERRAGYFYRRYQVPASLAQTVGFAHPTLGLSGLEQAADHWLRPGPFSLSRRGYNVYTTFHLAVQEAAERALAGRKGAIVALDPRTGAILALASTPGYELERLTEEWPRLRSDKRSPLFNRALGGLYPPGSVFKIVTLAAALEEGKVSPKSVYFCPGQRTIEGQAIACAERRAHGVLTLTQALGVSCNYVFTGLGLAVGWEGLKRKAADFGLTEAPPLELAVEAGRFPPPQEGPGVAQLAIGQGELLVTPLGMTLVCAAVANEGKIMAPYLIQYCADEQGHVVWRQRTRVWRRALEPEVAREIKRMMVAVMEYGTGRPGRLHGVEIAGKTGTAENPSGKPHAWFIGFAPASEPRVAVGVIVESGGGGGTVAAPLAASVLAAALEHVQ